MSRTQPAAALEGPDLAAAPDEQVVTQALVGHQLAAREIVRRYQRPVFNLIVRMVQDAGTAEDLAQETFVKVFRSLQTFDVRLRFAAWILKIAHNTTLDYLRRHRPHLVPLDAPVQGERGNPGRSACRSAAVSPERSAERQQLRAALDAAIDRLRPEYRRVRRAAVPGGPRLRGDRRDHGHPTRHGEDLPPSCASGVGVRAAQDGLGPWRR